MLVPRLLEDSFFGDFPFGSLNHFGHSNSLMKTDVKETDSGYELAIDMPGIKKDAVKVELKDGYITVSAEANYSNDDKDTDGRYIRRERHYGSCSRSFYVGEAITQDEINASFNDGVLKLTVPKKHELPESHNYIPIK